MVHTIAITVLIKVTESTTSRVTVEHTPVNGPTSADAAESASGTHRRSVFIEIPFVCPEKSVRRSTCIIETI